jgi:hypothetical protein
MCSLKDIKYKRYFQSFMNAVLCSPSLEPHGHSDNTRAPIFLFLSASFYASSLFHEAHTHLFCKFRAINSECLRLSTIFLIWLRQSLLLDPLSLELVRLATDFIVWLSRSGNAICSGAIVTFCLQGCSEKGSFSQRISYRPQ